jgi:glutamate 5-kinase
LVSSGAIASGCAYLKIKTRPRDIVSLQATAAVGQSLLMQAYNDLFRRGGRLSGQVLLTWEDFNERRRYLNAKNTISELLEKGIIPVINENDVVAVDEIKFGDNDKLSALVANLIEADLLVILSDVDGLYKTENRKTEIIPLVEEINSDIKKLVSDEKGDLCVGGMTTKLEAVKIASEAGIPSIIANGKKENILLEIIQKKAVGTFFLPKKSNLVARKRWIAFGAKPKGYVVVDDGACEVLLKRGKSLLSPGIIEVRGSFKKLDIIGILDKFNREFARGRVECDSEQLKEIKGKRFHKEVIHRDNLAVL